jgi:lipoprotein NlpI
MAKKMLNVVTTKNLPLQFPCDAMFYYLMGFLTPQDTALQHFNKATQIDPSYVEAHHNKSRALVYLGRHQEAKEVDITNTFSNIEGIRISSK